METRSIVLLVPDEGLLFESAGISEIFDQANRAVEGRGRAYGLTLATPQRNRVVRGRSGLTLLADARLADLDPGAAYDTLLVTGRGGDADSADAIADWLRQAAPRARRVVSVCAGTFILAQAGLLAGKRVTTHWARAAELAERYPELLVDADKIYINDGKIWTSAGASAGFDLALALVEQDLGSQAALQVSRFLVMYLRRPGGQSQFSRYLEVQAGEPGPVRDTQAWALENLDADLSLERLADRAAMSPRNFLRVFSRQTGTTPARFVEQIRLDAARQRLESGGETIDQVALRCGFGSALTMRRSFERSLGVNPSEYRQRFGAI